MNEIISRYIEELRQKQEQIIIDTARQGYNYIAIKTQSTNDIIFKDGGCSMKMKYTYQGYYTDLGFGHMLMQGYTLYDLKPVKEYLEKMDEMNGGLL